MMPYKSSQPQTRDDLVDDLPSPARRRLVILDALDEPKTVAGLNDELDGETAPSRNTIYSSIRSYEEAGLVCQVGAEHTPRPQTGGPASAVWIRTVDAVPLSGSFRDSLAPDVVAKVRRHRESKGQPGGGR